jgi:hypothetical protein
MCIPYKHDPVQSRNNYQHKLHIKDPNSDLHIYQVEEFSHLPDKPNCLGSEEIECCQDPDANNFTVERLDLFRNRENSVHTRSNHEFITLVPDHMFQGDIRSKFHLLRKIPRVHIS